MQYLPNEPSSRGKRGSIRALDKNGKTDLQWAVMKLACNIDRRGRIVRLVMGIVLIAIALPLLIFWAPANGLYAWAVSVGVLISGIFGLFEAAKGWCLMRAIGCRVPY